MRASKLDKDDWKKVEQGLRLPWLDKYQPDLDDGILLYWYAWNVLHPGRQRSMGGVSGIKFSEMCAWMDEYEIRGRDERDRFLALVGRMDGVYCNRVSEDMKRAGKDGG